MGATVTCNKLAAAFRASTGTIHYVLFEETYEKNCHPHTPDWSCTHIGDIDSTLKRVFAYASHCEGGMLQGRGGHITPEGYIRSWLNELAAPVHFEDRVITLKVDKSFSAVLPEAKLVEIEDALTSLGRRDIADAMKKGEARQVSLYANAELLSALTKAGVSAWRYQWYCPQHGTRDTGLGYQPSPAKAKQGSPATPVFLNVDGNNRLQRQDNGTWVCAGWAYSIVGEFIANYASVELNLPGTASKAIKSFRTAVEAALPIPPGIRVRVDRAKAAEITEKWVSDKIKGAEALPGAMNCGDHFEIEVDQDQIGDKGFLYKLCQLPASCTQWILPAEQPRIVTEVEQMSFI